MREGLLDRLEPVFAAILAGRHEDEVYALWRELTAVDVAGAERRRGLETHLAPTPGRAPAAPAETVTVVPAPADAIPCAVVADTDDEDALAVLAASLAEHSSRPLHLWLLASARSDGLARRLAERCPGVGVSEVAIGGVPRDLVPALLPHLLPAVGRVVLLPLPAIATGDIAELHDLALGDHALAAPTRPGTENVSGFGIIHAAAARLRRRTDAAAALRRTAHARHRFDFDAFDTDVMVLDLERMRRDELAEAAGALAAEYGLDGAEVLHYLVGPRRAIVPARWAIVPTRSPERGPGLIYWADPVKPWEPELTPERDRWRDAASRAPSPA